MRRKVTPGDRSRKALMEAVGEASLDFSGYYAAQARHRTSACSRTVCVAFSCLSGG